MNMISRCLLICCVAFAAACNGCALRPLGVSCQSIAIGQVKNRGVVRDDMSLSESHGAQEARTVCRIIYSIEDIEAELAGEADL